MNDKPENNKDSKPYVSPAMLSISREEEREKLQNEQKRQSEDQKPVRQPYQPLSFVRGDLSDAAVRQENPPKQTRRAPRELTSEEERLIAEAAKASARQDIRMVDGTGEKSKQSASPRSAADIRPVHPQRSKQRAKPAAPSAVKEKLPAKAAPNQSKKETKPQGKQAAQKRGKPSKKKAVQKTRRGKRNYTLYYLTFGLFSAIVLLILSYTVLFPVTDITVKTTDPEIVISPEAAQTYIESSGLSKGNNLLRVNAKTTEQNILASDPTIDAVTLHKKLPGKLVVEVNVARPWCAFYNAADKLYYSVSENGRVIAAGKKKELPLTEKTVFVTGFTLEDCEVGSYYDERAVLQKRVDAADAALAKAKEADKPQAEKDKMAAESELRRYELYLTMRDKLVEYGLTEVTAMDMRRSSNISFTWQKRVRVELGGYTDMEYKLKLANTILTQELDAKAKGTLNLSVPKLPGFREDL